MLRVYGLRETVQAGLPRVARRNPAPKKYSKTLIQIFIGETLGISTHSC